MIFFILKMVIISNTAISAITAFIMIYPSGASLPRLSWKKAVKQMYYCYCSSAFI